jgi:hypothetical protein
MNGNIPGLSEHDLDILRSYADEGNRELYWNYLAQLPGNDGYGLLALGVVRNDNMPGATANEYAVEYARTHDGKVLTERQWNEFGVDLIRNDLHARANYIKSDPALALNLPAKAVEEAHSQSFEKSRISPDAWTPRRLLEAARNAPGHTLEENERTVEAIWKDMLNNDLAGVGRTTSTLGKVAMDNAMSAAERASYTYDMSTAYLRATRSMDHINPDVIGSAGDAYVRRDDGKWVHVGHSGFLHSLSIGVVTDPAKIRELDDTRELRLEQAKARHAFHPDDPGHLMKSPHPLAEAAPRTSMPGITDDPVYAAIRRQLPLEVSDDKAAEVALAARRAGIGTRDDFAGAELSRGLITCEGVRPGVSVHVSAETPAPPREQSMLAIHQHDQAAQMQVLAQQAQQAQAVQHGGPAMRM